MNEKPLDWRKSTEDKSRSLMVRTKPAAGSCAATEAARLVFFVVAAYSAHMPCRLPFSRLALNARTAHPKWLFTYFQKLQTIFHDVRIIAIGV